MSTSAVYLKNLSFFKVAYIGQTHTYVIFLPSTVSADDFPHSSGNIATLESLNHCDLVWTRSTFMFSSFSSLYVYCQRESLFGIFGLTQDVASKIPIKAIGKILRHRTMAKTSLGRIKNHQKNSFH